jgi:hypothetical protein
MPSLLSREAHRRRGTLVPGTVVWTANEDELVRITDPHDRKQLFLSIDQ